MFDYVDIKVFVHTTFHSFSYRAEGDGSVILGKRLVFLLVNWCNISFFPGGN